MPIDTNEPTAALSQLATDLADVIRGYEAMDPADDSEHRAMLERLHDMHKAHAAELMTAIEAMGGRPEDTGSMMGAVDQAAATGRNWFGSDSPTQPETVAEGEARLLAVYDAALPTVAPRPDLHHLLTRHRKALAERVEALLQG